MRVAITTLGCKVNQYESAAMGESLEKHGFLLVPFLEEADFYIINTCTVTGRTDYQSRQLIRRAGKRNPQAAIIVTGCYAQTAPDVFTGMPGVTVVAGTLEKDRIAEIIGEIKKNTQLGRTAGPVPSVQVGDVGGEITEWGIRPVSRFPGHTRAFLKIQDGCNAFCSYCIVPYARGRSRSIGKEEVLERIQSLARNGYSEVVLTGIHLGVYGEDRQDGSSLAGILRQVEEHRTIERLRLSSLEPREITEEILEIMKSARIICPHLHIPLQSGDDGILSSMGRNYDAAFFRDLVGKVCATRPDMTVGMDVMVGFPGEDEKAFENTIALIESLPIAYLHVFPYSRRPGTAAALMGSQVGEEDKKRRGQTLRQLGMMKRQAFLGRFIGSTMPVLIEKRKDRPSGYLKGFSHNYLPVLLQDGRAEMINTIVSVKSESLISGGLVGRVHHG
ncbi:MAG TPA: tRNA (N(6)-L-threonylcarbamoyladenosine(37)-C(2))-methylthiotransferase MtaB [Syntrophus sp. (in: bacteria)]|jgi:threonylcarbamoyladenosine tRNA methylthiotransferase MtaB|nr:tRNA (N(6)-L-threonylcarbamoyladenosine(37)-C(2))-methylthiotransferase MtaB [Syntrophus sp. (in: bacteria)]